MTMTSATTGSIWSLWRRYSRRARYEIPSLSGGETRLSARRLWWNMGLFRSVEGATELRTPRIQRHESLGWAQI